MPSVRCESGRGKWFGADGHRGVVALLSHSTAGASLKPAAAARSSGARVAFLLPSRARARARSRHARVGSGRSHSVILSSDAARSCSFSRNASRAASLQFEATAWVTRVTTTRAAASGPSLSTAGPRWSGSHPTCTRTERALLPEAAQGPHAALAVSTRAKSSNRGLGLIVGPSDCGAGSQFSNLNREPCPFTAPVARQSAPTPS